MNLRNFLVNDESGQDMVEYVLILAFVAVGAAAIITTIGTGMSQVWSVTSYYVSQAGSIVS